MSANIDPVTGLPDLSSDVYQIPLNTDSLPYKDLQAEDRLPRQPLLPDDIIPTIALLTGLDSDNTGQVVHTDDNHAAKVYVVNQSTSGGGSGPYTVNNYILSQFTAGFGDERLQSIGPIGKPIRGFTCSFTLDTGEATPQEAIGYVSPYVRQEGGDTTGFFLGSIAIHVNSVGTVFKGSGEVTMYFDGGLLIESPHDDGFGQMVVWLRSQNVGGGVLNLHIWQDA